MRVHAVEISYVRRACSMIKWESESNENMYERSDMKTCVNGVKCGVEEWVKRNTLWWFDHME